MTDIVAEFAIAAVIPSAQMLAFLVIGLLFRADRCDK